MIRQLVRSVVVGVLVGVLVAFGGTSAYAAYVTSTWKHFTSNGVNYMNQSVMYDSSNSQTRLNRNSSGNSGVGRMGARARVYFSSGSLCNASVTRYNSTRTDYFEVIFDSNCGGYIYSRGFTETWNGNGYARKSTNRTPNIGPL